MQVSKLMKILNRESRDPKTNTGPQKRSKVKHRAKNYSATVFGITLQASMAIVDSKWEQL